jgi:hypothetical protein
MIKIRIGKATAEYKDGGPWVSDSKNIEGLLNTVSSPLSLDNRFSYYPSTEHAILILIKETIGEGIEVLEFKPAPEPPAPAGVKY